MVKQRRRPDRGREQPSRKVERVLSMIKRLTASELGELSKRLQANPDWPGPEKAPVGVKPKTGPPALSASAEVERPKEQ